MRFDKTICTLFFVVSILFAFSCTKSGGGSSSENDEYLTPDGANVTINLTSGEAQLQLLDNDQNKKNGNDNSKANEKQSSANDESDDAENPEYAESTRSASQAEFDECAKALGLTPEKLVYVGNKQTFDISAGSAIFAKVRGNKANVNIKIAGKNNEKISGLCIFTRGNKITVNITQESSVDRLYYRGRGNKSVTTLALKAPATVENADLEVTGNKAQLSIQAPTKELCEQIQAKVIGHKTSLTCTP
ncbi:MAG: hypothetical protein HQK54_12485 [Oligoflexales bacterium]|nr:hypothetical protein [Oligoflexales bacterium]